MVTRRETRRSRSSKKVRNLPAKPLKAEQAKTVKGGDNAGATDEHRLKQI